MLNITKHIHESETVSNDMAAYLHCIFYGTLLYGLIMYRLNKLFFMYISSSANKKQILCSFGTLIAISLRYHNWIMILKFK